MAILYSPQLRTERLIIFSRTGLAAFSWLAIWLDPIEPQALSGIIQQAVGAYLVYALSLAILLWLAPLQINRLALVSHVIDILAYTALVAITDTETSPFFGYFAFALFGAAMRWQRVGTLWTALAFFILFSFSALFNELQYADNNFELNHFLIRNIRLMLITLLLIYLTHYEKNTSVEFRQLAEWPALTMSNRTFEEQIHETLSYARSLLKAPRLLVLWEVHEEPALFQASLDEDQLRIDTFSPDYYLPLINPVLENCHIMCSDMQLAPAKIVYTKGRGFDYYQGSALNPELIRHHRIRAMIGLALTGRSFQGYLLVLDKTDMTPDDLSLGILVAQQVANHFDQIIHQMQQQALTAAEERIKMAHDLHDGVLQTLTGVALQLKNLDRIIESRPAEAKSALGHLQTSLVIEQRQLRRFIRKLNPTWPNSAHSSFKLSESLNHLAKVVKQQWNLNVQIAAPKLPDTWPTELKYQLYHLIREGLVNCARHAQAANVQINLRFSDNTLNIQIRDDGKGFPFTGQYSLTELIALQRGPKSILQRIQTLHGQLTIQSSRHGATLDIVLPIPPGENDIVIPQTEQSV